MYVRAKKTERGIASYESSRIDNELRKNSAWNIQIYPMHYVNECWGGT